MAQNINGQVVEEGIVTIDDAKSGEVTKYDAFICYQIEDADDRKFVQKIITKLENEPERKRKLKLFVPGRDDLPGAAQHTINAYLIEKRCRRIVILLSKAFHSSQACDFQIKFAHALEPGGKGKRLIPVIREQGVILPRLLRIIAPLDFTKPDIEDWIWDRLYTAIVANYDQYYLDSKSSSIESLIGITFPIYRRLKDDNDVHSDESGIGIGNRISRTSSVSSSAPMFKSSAHVPLRCQDEGHARLVGIIIKH